MFRLSSTQALYMFVETAVGAVHFTETGMYAKQLYHHGLI